MVTGTEFKEELASSSETAYRKFIDEYGGYVYAIAYNKLRSVCDTAETDECVSDIFAEIFMKLNPDELDGRDMKGLVGTVTKRRCVDYYRKHLSDKTVFIDDESAQTLASGDDIEADNERGETRRILLSKIDELGEPDSEIIIRKYYYNQNSTEIAKRMKLNASSVRSRCKRALEKLKILLADVGITM